VLANPSFPYFKDGSSMAFGGVGVTQIDQFTYQARAFLDQVIGLDEGLSPVPSFAHGYRAIRIQDAVARCAAQGGAAVAIDF
jgi:predicted dehydrogenase